MRDFIVMLFWVTLLGSLLGWGSVELSWWKERSQCESRSVSFEEHNWEVWQGCMVKHKGKWYPLNNVRITE